MNIRIQIMSDSEDINEKIVQGVLGLRKHLGSRANRIIDSSTATTNYLKSCGDVSFSDFPECQLRMHQLDDSPILALELIQELQPLLERQNQVQAAVYGCWEHLCNFIQNFQLIAHQLPTQNHLSFKSYKYCLEHLEHTITTLAKCNFDELDKQKSIKNYMREINSIVDDIHKRIDRIEGKYRHPKIKNSNENLLMEISKLKQQVQDYEKERQTFIKVHAYYEQQLQKKQEEPIKYRSYSRDFKIGHESQRREEKNPPERRHMRKGSHFEAVSPHFKYPESEYRPMSRVKESRQMLEDRPLSKAKVYCHQYY